MKLRGLLLAALVLAGCGGPAHRERLSGPYLLQAIDSREDMAIVLDLGGGATVGDGLPRATVFATGADARYVVAARHPNDIGKTDDHLVTEYWYVVRSPEEFSGRVPQGIVGPLTEAEFAAAKARLNLPEFTRVFEDLR